MKRLAGLLLLILILLSAWNYWPTRPINGNIQIDRILVEKSRHRMSVFSGDERIKVYNVSLGMNPNGDKLKQGDLKTPVGKYYISGKNPNSDFYLSLRVSYPSREDREETKRLLGSDADPGGDIMIHGLPSGFGFIGKLHRLMDWTAGCIAVTNSEIKQINEHTNIGTPIEIKE